MGTRVVTRWVGFAVLSLACINMLARTDTGSPALTAVIVGNIVFHALGLSCTTSRDLTRVRSAPLGAVWLGVCWTLLAARVGSVDALPAGWEAVA